jgi:DNA-directed RNA polymerase alpha subunit
MAVIEKILASLSFKELNDLEYFVIKEKEKRKISRVIIEELDLSVRLKNSLKRADFETLNELTDFTRQQIRKFNGFGWKSIIELEEIMGKYNLFLKK